VPLSKVQSEILRTLAAYRNPESYVAGSTPLHRDGPHIHERHLPLGAVIWAAVGKDPGYSPESLIAEIRRNARYRADEYEALAMATPIDAGAVARQLRAALDEAEAFARAMPAGKEGLLFLHGAVAVQPDPAQLDSYTELEGRRQAIWPGSSEISAAMLEHQSGPHHDEP
jgi:hypothetical protein